jgi:hypothetical protein
MMEELLGGKVDDVKAKLADEAAFYKTDSMETAPTPKGVPIPALRAVLQLRFIASKSCLSELLLLLQTWEVHRERLLGNSVQVPEGTVFERAQAAFRVACDDIVRLASSCLHLSGMNEGGVDRDSLLNEFIQHELELARAKDRLICVVLECFEHCPCDDLRNLLLLTICERPKIPQEYFRSPREFLAAWTENFHRRGELLRALVNAHFIHEQRCAAASAGGLIPAFDVPSLFALPRTSRWPQSVPLNAYEIYPEVERVSRVLSIVRASAVELCYETDVWRQAFGVFVENAFLAELEARTTRLIAVAGGADLVMNLFGLRQSEAVMDLFAMRLDFDRMTENMTEIRKARFAASARRFIRLIRKLKTELLLSDQRGVAYDAQASSLGIGQRETLLQAFVEVMEAGSETASGISELEFALSEFEPVILNLSTSARVREYVVKGEYRKLVQLVRYQRLQNAILEVALRVNGFFADAETVKGHLRPQSAQADLFITRPIADRGSKLACVFVRTPQLEFMDAHFTEVVVISNVKRHARLILGALRNGPSAADTYAEQISGTFESLGFRREIALEIGKERQFHFLNQQGDLFFEGTGGFVENGRLSSWWYIPTVQEASLSTEVMLPDVLTFVKMRRELAELVRVEVSLGYPQEQLFDALSRKTFSLESLMLLRLGNELRGLANGRDASTANLFLAERLRIHKARFTIAAARAWEAASMTNDHRREMTRLEVEVEGKRYEFSGSAAAHLAEVNGLGTGVDPLAFTPCCSDLCVVSEMSDSDRLQLAQMLGDVDVLIELGSRSLKSGAFGDIYAIIGPLARFLVEVAVVARERLAYYALSGGFVPGAWRTMIDQALDLVYPGERAEERKKMLQTFQGFPYVRFEAAARDVLDGWMHEVLAGVQLQALTKGQSAWLRAIPEGEVVERPAVLNDSRFSEAGSPGRPKPDTLDRQFRHELSYLRLQTVSRAEIVECCASDVVSAWGQYLKLAEEMGTRGRVLRDWAECVADQAERSIQGQIDCHAAREMVEDLCRVNEMLDELRLAGELAGPFELGQVRDVRGQMEGLLGDVQHQLDVHVSLKEEVRHEVLTEVLRRIRAGLDGQIAPPPSSASSRSRQMASDGAMIVSQGEENAELRKRLVLARVLSALHANHMAASFEKRREMLAADHKSAYGQLVALRLAFTLSVTAFEESLAEAMERRRALALELVRLNDEFDAARAHSAQAIHWRGLAQVREKHLRESLAKLKWTEDAGVCQLLSSLDERRAELDDLSGAHAKYEASVDEEVRRPAAEAEAVRQKMRTVSLRVPMPPRPFDDTLMRIGLERTTLESENAALRESIARVESKLNAILKLKLGRSREIITRPRLPRASG